MELETVKDEIRDEVMKNILSIPSNQSCFDCGNKRPRWASPYLGIIICLECAGRHRSYGTHISFVKSVDLDKWKKKQLKSLELTGNLYMKKKFEKLKIPKINNIYDYNNEFILTIRKDIENLVKENLKPEDYTNLDEIKKNGNENAKNIEKISHIKNNINNIDNDNENNEKLSNLSKPVKFNIKKKDSSNNKENKKSKIKKLDIDFDFDNFEESGNDKETEKEIDPKKIQGMKISRIDKKKALIEQKNKNKNDENKSLCQKVREYIYHKIYTSLMI
jgi:hypothetical protein